MKYLHKFSKFDNIFEATFNSDKSGVSYTPNKKGKSSLSRFGLDDINTLEYTDEKPNPDDEILLIRPSSFQISNWDGSEEYLFYKTGNNKIPFSAAKIGSRSTVVVQKERVGSSKRGDYFREMAFIIVLAQEIWKKLGIKIPVYGKIEEVVFEYVTYEDGKRDSYIVTGEDKKAFDKFHANEILHNAAVSQSEKLIEWLGESVHDISSLIKNSNDLLPNFIADDLLTDEVNFFKDVMKNASDFEGMEYYKIPDKASTEKWNPSDMWICFKGYEDGFMNPKFWENYNSSIDDLNEFFRESIIQKNGIIGVSLKQETKGMHRPYDVNIRGSEIKHRFLGDDISSENKTATIYYKYKIGKAEGRGKIDFRTFDTKINSGLGIEVKGSLKSGHVSGKAGAILKYILPTEVYKNMEFIKKEKDITKIIGKFRPSLIDLPGNDFVFRDQQVESVFLDDLERQKDQVTNSRMQAAIFFDWYLSQTQSVQNKIISDIIRFAKSESDWSAAHVILK